MTELNELQELAEAAFELQQDVERCKEKSDNAKEALRIMVEVTLPEAMDDAEMASISTKSGLIIQVDQVIYTKKVVNPAALAFLVAAGEGGMIKSDVVVAFGQKEEAEADALRRELAERDLSTKVDKHVNAGTVKSWITRQLAAGNDVDLDLFGAYGVQEAKITLPKK